MKEYYSKRLPYNGKLVEGLASDLEAGPGEIVRMTDRAGEIKLCFRPFYYNRHAVATPVEKFPSLKTLGLFMCTRLLRPGGDVWWNDPAGETSDLYKVQSIGSEDGLNYEDDTIILIVNEFSEAEVYASELETVMGLISKQAIWIAGNQRFDRLDWQWASLVKGWEAPGEDDYIMVKCPCCGVYV